MAIESMKEGSVIIVDSGWQSRAAIAPLPNLVRFTKGDDCGLTDLPSRSGVSFMALIFAISSNDAGGLTDHKVDVEDEVVQSSKIHHAGGDLAPTKAQPTGAACQRAAQCHASN